MARPALRIEVSTKDQKDAGTVASALGGGHLRRRGRSDPTNPNVVLGPALTNPWRQGPYLNDLG